MVTLALLSRFSDVYAVGELSRPCGHSPSPYSNILSSTVTTKRLARNDRLHVLQHQSLHTKGMRMPGVPRYHAGKLRVRDLHERGRHHQSLNDMRAGKIAQW